MPTTKKPFEITKAVDFTDPEIESYWVDLPGGGGFKSLVDPCSPVPVILLGGKGSGRTHLMRYYSYPLQKLRAGEQPILKRLQQDGYVGVYIRCSGLNAGRFEGKGIPAESWEGVFAYYFDLWLGEVTLLTFFDALGEGSELQAELCSRVMALFDIPADETPTTFKGLVDAFRSFRQEIDIAVNNVAITRAFDARIRSTRGRLVFGIPQILLAYKPLRKVQLVYLVDELENLTEPQQIYLNTLIREKEAPSTFTIGSRLYGFRTQKTFSGGEDNRAGSEYDLIILDDQLREDPRYEEFARDLVARRLEESGYSVPDDSKQRASFLKSLFAEYPSADFSREQTQFVIKAYENAERPYFTKLRKSLEAAIPKKGAPNVKSNEEVGDIIASLEISEYPLLEKANILLLYRAWSKGHDLLRMATHVHSECKKFLKTGVSKEYKDVFKYFRADLTAQLLRECRQQQQYLGMQTFIDMSAGLPRNLLLVLKSVHRWSLFYGESPFEGKEISIRAQQDGVREEANRFLQDARAIGTNADFVQASIVRLAQFFHSLRFSDKPAESSLVTFSYDPGESSSLARQTIKEARDVSLLLDITGGQKERNSEGVLPKYQLNPMICPRFDLPIRRRGTVDLNNEEVEAIFGEMPSDERRDVLSVRLTAMNAPFAKRKGRSDADNGPESGTEGFGDLLPGIL